MTCPFFNFLRVHSFVIANYSPKSDFTLATQKIASSGSLLEIQDLRLPLRLMKSAF